MFSVVQAVAQDDDGPRVARLLLAPSDNHQQAHCVVTDFVANSSPALALRETKTRSDQHEQHHSGGRHEAPGARIV